MRQISRDSSSTLCKLKFIKVPRKEKKVIKFCYWLWLLTRIYFTTNLELILAKKGKKSTKLEVVLIRDWISEMECGINLWVRDEIWLAAKYRGGNQVHGPRTVFILNILWARSCCCKCCFCLGCNTHSSLIGNLVYSSFRIESSTYIQVKKQITASN